MRFLSGLGFAGVVFLMLAQPGRAAGPHNIAVFGDSLADGAWSGLYQELKAEPQDELYRDSKVGTGITRPDYDDFVAGFTASLAPEHVTDVVVMFGANDDGSSLRDETHKGYLYATPGWTKVYQARVQNIVTTCERQGIKVFWLGLPVMRDAQRNQGALFLNGIIQQVVTGNGGIFVPLEDDFKDTGGNFATHLPDAQGDLRDVRAEDGVHFSFYGYDLIAKKVLAEILAPAAPLAAAKPAITAPPSKS
jgi:hypothetical protein